MTILFVAYLENDAIVRCVQQLQAGLLAQDVRSDLLTFRWNRALPLEERTEFGLRYRADTWYRHAQLQRDADGRIAMPWYGYLRVALARGISALLGGMAYQEQGFPFAAGRRLGRKVRSLCLQNRYDWVVSVSYPFMMHRLVRHYHPQQTRWAMYALDPFYHNATYAPRREAARLRLEREVSGAADGIFHVPEQAEDYARAELLPLRAKYHPLDYPNFIRPEPSALPDPLRVKSGTVNLVYLGTLYANIRKPDALLTLFEHMHAGHPELRLHLIGNVFGLGAGETVARAKERLGEALQTYLPMRPDMARAALQAADVLVNIGNTVQNQMPSKLWEYIALGKPILNICMARDCNTLPYLSVYPHALNVWADQADQEQTAGNAADFCLSRVNCVVPWAQLCEIYREHGTDEVVRRFLETLEGTQTHEGNVAPPSNKGRGEA